MTIPQIQRLEAWMKEITDLICYQPEVPTAHKSELMNAFVAFQNEIPEASDDAASRRLRQEADAAKGVA